MNKEDYYKEKKRINRRKKAKKRKRVIQLFIFIMLCTIIVRGGLLVGQAISHFNTNIGSDRGDQLYFDDAYILDQLKQMSKDNKEIEGIIESIEKYPNNLLQSLVKNPEMTDFVLHYLHKKDRLDPIKLTDEEIREHIPLFLQWDERWGYAKYGDDIMALAGCGPTCLSMVIVGVTGNTSANPREVAQFSESKGYWIPNNGTDWDLLTDGVKAYGLEAKELPLWESRIIQEIQGGHPIICSVKPGDFTTTGHFIVIYGYEDGYFLIHDPNSIERSNKRWDFDTIKGQIRNLWTYSKQNK